MTDPNQAFMHKLLTLFAEEAREHLRAIDAGLLALEQAGAAAPGALVQPMLKSLHTLKGAARAVDLGDLERLCHALEGVFSARAAGGALAPADFDRLHQSLGLARQLTGAPGGRIRNQASALCTQLDQLAGQLLAAAGAEPHTLAWPGPEVTPPAPMQGAGASAAAEPGARAPAVMDGGSAELIRIDAAKLDAIRREAEALLAVELGLRHQIETLRALAEAMAVQRREAEREPASQPDAGSASLGLQCAHLAAQLDASCSGFNATRTRLMDAILETSLVPFAAALTELPALVRNLARSSGKQAVLRMAGESVPVDRRILGLIREVLMHLVTNAVDHGIETPAARAGAGKETAGEVSIAISQRDSRHVLLRVSDDGAGIDVAGVSGAAARHGSVDAAGLELLGERQRLELVLRAGVSTRSRVTPVSGRGMGLSIVADRVAAVGGQLGIVNGVGRGCTFELLLPVRLASLRALVVGAGGLRYVVPLAGLELVRALVRDEVQTVENRETLVQGGRVIPLLRLATLFGTGQPQTGPHAAGVALVARAPSGLFAVLVDEIVAEQDVLPRSLGRLLRRVRYVTGATQLGDGSLVPILGLDDIAAHALGKGIAGPAAGSDASAPRRVLVVEDSITSRLLLKHILEAAGCQVETAVDGLDALSKLRQGRYDAVVSDVEMPHLDGLALTASIRANPKTAELPVILVTSLQSAAERERGLHAGADAYLTKGAFDQDKLLVALRRLI